MEQSWRIKLANEAESTRVFYGETTEHIQTVFTFFYNGAGKSRYNIITAVFINLIRGGWLFINKSHQGILPFIRGKVKLVSFVACINDH